MLENPWKELERQREARLADEDDSVGNRGNALSDSLVPQVDDDSIMERNDRLAINPAPEVAEPGDKSLSDSMVPLVGDSLVQSQDVSMEDDE